MRTRSAVLVSGAAGVVVGSVVTLCIALAQCPGSDDSARPDDSATSALVTVPVTSQVLTDSEVVSGALAWADAASVLASEGVVTEMPLADGAEVVPGQVVVEVNGSPVVALHMRFGLWRDLEDGAVGADVAELHAALAELGMYDGDPAAPFDATTRAGLAQIDPRLGEESLTPDMVAAVDLSGSTVSAPGVGVGTRLGETTVSVLRHSDRLAVADSGLAAEYVLAGQRIELFDEAGDVAWRGTVGQVDVEESRTLLTLTGDDALPAEPVAASITVDQTAGEVLVVPRATIVARPDGTSTVTVLGSDGDEAVEVVEVVVSTGLCARDLCEVTLAADSEEPGLVPGTLVVVP